MHGIVFAALRDFVAEHLDQGRADRVFGTQPPYLMSSAYPDEDFLRLLERARELAGEPAAEFLRAFGAFTGARTFPRLYPAYYEVAGGTRAFLLTLENRIHELVRATIPNATPPRLGIEAVNDHGLRIRYDSPRRLCAFLHGLVDGTATHYAETVEVVEETCMSRGDAACLFTISVGQREE